MVLAGLFQFSIDRSSFRLWKLAMLLFFVVHVIGALWFCIARLQPYTGESDDGDGWLPSRELLASPDHGLKQCA